MLKLILGKAGTGKTAAVIREISSAVAHGQGGKYLLVPEQYSHEAERELARACGDSMSLYAEVFSFTGLARRILSLAGGGAEERLDKGGRFLCMALALKGLAGRLSVYTAAASRPEQQTMLLSAVDECKAACITPELLEKTAEECSPSLAAKLRDLALILAAFDSIVSSRHRLDPADILTAAARLIPVCPLPADAEFFVDGFTDFTGQELLLLEALLRRGCSLTVCLTADGNAAALAGNSGEEALRRYLSRSNELYSLAAGSARKLAALAADCGTELSVTVPGSTPGKAEAIEFFAEYLLGYAPEGFPGENRSVSLHTAGGMVAECEFAAAEALRLVRETGCRWRDIAIAVRGFDSYRPALESIFRHYGVPLFVSSKDDLFSRPLPAMIAGLFDIVEGRWLVDDVLSFTGTGLTGLTTEEADLLADYIFKWQLTARHWETDADWVLNPAGYDGSPDRTSPEKLAAQAAQLKEINAVRRRLADPIRTYERIAHSRNTAAGQAEALAGYFTAVSLPERLQQRAELLEAEGRSALANEYIQLWDIIAGALEQCSALLGDAPMSAAEFGSFFLLMLSKYDVGTIPVSLDSVSAGDFDRMRRRHLKHLIILGADDTRLPQPTSSGGVFSEAERLVLNEKRLALNAGEDEVWREFSLIYNTITLPSDSLTLVYSAVGQEGKEQRPSFVAERARKLFSLTAQPVDLGLARLSAEGPALNLAARAGDGATAAESTAAAYFAARKPGHIDALRAAAEPLPQQLSPATAEKLYGKSPRLSASRVEKWVECPFCFFVNNGLKAEPYEPARLAATNYGSFTHDVFEHTLRAVMDRGGFEGITEEEVIALSNSCIEEYIQKEFKGFEGQTERTQYLFRRHIPEIHSILREMTREFKTSAFAPDAFELDITDTEAGVSPMTIQGEAGSLSLTGFVDRVDTFRKNGKTYLRVVDYKTGKKEFELDDIVYGKNLQMLLYLYVLEKNAAARYGEEIVPAGIMYIPAKDPVVSAGYSVDPAKLDKARRDKAHRMGVVLDDPEVLAAWEQDGDNRFLPKETKDRRMETYLSREQLELLEEHLVKTLTATADGLRTGDISLHPYYRDANHTACSYCKYQSICHFESGQRGACYRYLPKLKGEDIYKVLRGEPAGGNEEEEGEDDNG